MASAGSMREAGYSKSAFWENPEGFGGEGGGRGGSGLGDTCAPVANSC